MLQKITKITHILDITRIKFTEINTKILSVYDKRNCQYYQSLDTLPLLLLLSQY